MTAYVIWLALIVLGIFRVCGCKAVARLWMVALLIVWLGGADPWLSLAPCIVLGVTEMICFLCDRFGVRPFGRG